MEVAIKGPAVLEAGDPAAASDLSEMCFWEGDSAQETPLAQEEAVLMLTGPSWRRGLGLHHTDLGFNPSSTSLGLRGVGGRAGTGWARKGGNKQAEFAHDLISLSPRWSFCLCFADVERTAQRDQASCL